MHYSLSTLDWAVLALYSGVVFAIGVSSGRKEKNAEDYFLAGRKMPWWAVTVSIYATALSALTFIGVPGVAFAGDFHYLQLGIGDFFGRLLIARLLLTAYYRGKVMTVYEYLGQRFGAGSHGATTALFIITRVLASAVRLAGCAIALGVVFSIPISTAIPIIALLAFSYILMGGIRAVIWTDMMQFLLVIITPLVALAVIFHALPQGWSDFVAIGTAHKKFTIFHISFIPGDADYWLNLANPESLIAGFVLGCFTTLAVLGTDQDLVQRMLTCEKVRDSQKALIVTALLNFPITLLFLIIGAALYVYYQVFPSVEVTSLVMQGKTDYVFPMFIKTVLAPGLRGLLIAGLLAAAMSSIDSASNALASTAYVDIYQRYIRRNAEGKHAVIVSRWMVVGFTVLLALTSILFSHSESILWVGFQIFGYTYGGMLGVFLLAVLTRRRGHDLANVGALASSILVVLFLTADLNGSLEAVRSAMLRPFGVRAFAWPWAIVIGMVWTFGVGVLFPTRQKSAA